MTRFLAWLFLPAVMAGCLDPVGSRVRDYSLDDAGLRVAFVGNSLTYTHDVPGLVQALANADGRSFSHVTIAEPNFSLEDHWYRATPGILRDVRADVVVMQQGPSTREASRRRLIRWSQQFAGLIREVGGEPALYMVWPSVNRVPDLSAVWSAYRAAADAADGRFIPAGQSCAEAWSMDETLELYGPDGYHPSRLGALAAAMTIYAVLYDLPADSVPELDMDVSDAVWGTLRAGVAGSLRMAADTATQPAS